VIDSSAIVDPSAELDEGVTVGPFAVIGPKVRIGKGTTIGSHAVVRGPTTIGTDNQIFQFTSIGDDPQDKKYAGEDTILEIGNRNVIREFVTMNRGTSQDRGATTIGSDNLFMVSTHVAHDCIIGDHVIMANGASLAGHVSIDDWAILGGFSLVHQFCRIGEHSFTGMNSVISKDIPPYVMVSGHPARPHGINSEGLNRRGFTAAAIKTIKRAYKTLYKERMKLTEATVVLTEMAQEHSEIAVMAKFLEASERSIVR
jgi:UDP-N-acetylglucosamine acyltransferase